MFKRASHCDKSVSPRGVATKKPGVPGVIPWLKGFEFSMFRSPSYYVTDVSKNGDTVIHQSQAK